MAWWPRHTPSSGVAAAAQARTSGIDAPARSGVPGPGTEQDAVELLGGLGDVGVGGQAVVVVTPHLRVHTELAQILDQVEHEAVVVVDDQDLHQARLLG